MAKQRDKKYILTKSDEAAYDAGCYIDESAPQRVWNFCDRYLNGFRFLDWQWHDIVFPLFAWREPDGARRFKVTYIFVPRGNGKTFGEAAISLSLQVVENHTGETTAWIGPTTDQAEISFNDALEIIGDGAGDWCKVTNYRRLILLAGAKIRVLASENRKSQRLHGYTGPMMIDELHGQNMASFEAAKTTANKSKHPLLMTISTAGKVRRGVAWEVWQDCLKILQGKIIDIHTLPVMYALKKVEHWQDFDKVLAVNPGVVQLGKTEDLRREWQDAIKKPWERPSFLRLHCNVWSMQSGRWLDVEKWISLTQIDPPDLHLWDCYLGLDLSKRNDLTTIQAVFVKGDRVHIKSFFWTPNRNLQEKSEKDELDYKSMAGRGYIELVEGDVINHTMLFNWIERHCKIWKVKRMGFDPALSQKLIEDLESLGVAVLPVYQGGRLTDAVQEFENLIDGKKLSHDGNGVMSYCVENVCLKLHEGKRYPVKENESSSLRIDGVPTALFGLKAYLLGNAVKGNGKKTISDESFNRQIDVIKSILSK